MSFSFNTIFPLTRSHHFSTDYFTGIVALVNDVLIEAKFDETAYNRLMNNATKIEKTTLRSKSAVIEVELLTHASWVDFELKFDGEGYRFTIDWKVNRDNIDGYIGYQFSAGVESKLHKDILEIINNIVKNDASDLSLSDDPFWERPLGRDEILEKQGQEEDEKKKEEKKRLEKIKNNEAQ